MRHRLNWVEMSNKPKREMIQSEIDIIKNYANPFWYLKFPHKIIIEIPEDGIYENCCSVLAEIIINKDTYALRSPYRTFRISSTEALLIAKDYLFPKIRQSLLLKYAPEYAISK